MLTIVLLALQIIGFLMFRLPDFVFKSFAVRINNICITKYNFAFWILASRRLARANYASAKKKEKFCVGG